MRVEPRQRRLATVGIILVVGGIGGALGVSRILPEVMLLFMGLFGGGLLLAGLGIIIIWFKTVPGEKNSTFDGFWESATGREKAIQWFGALFFGVWYLFGMLFTMGATLIGLVVAVLHVLSFFLG